MTDSSSLPVDIDVENSDALYRSIEGLSAVPLIGIIRGYPAEAAIRAARLAAEAGLRALEVTLDSPDAISVIQFMSRAESNITVGAGTVTTLERARAALSAGARFVVSPTTSVEVIRLCADSGVPAIPGAATPTEIRTALDGGASAVKLFPAKQLGGVDYLHAVRAPLDNPPLVPTGGITLGNVAGYLKAGAVAVGAGSSMFPPAIPREETWSELEALLSRWVEAVT
jgi:2-dehydro-3-deoxyphosphogluconate aldolase/(4S)-4-hydroxy-2-oxoglutarate aldolase